MQIEHLNITIKEVKPKNEYDFALEFIMFGIFGLIGSLIFYGFDLVIVLIAVSCILLGILVVLIIYILNNIKKDKYFKIDTKNNTLTIKNYKFKLYRLDNIILQAKIVRDDIGFSYKLTIFHEGKKVYKTYNTFMESPYFQSKEFLDKLSEYMHVQIIPPKVYKK